jgi:hypothetical protein
MMPSAMIALAGRDGVEYVSESAGRVINKRIARKDLAG